MTRRTISSTASSDMLDVPRADGVIACDCSADNSVAKASASEGIGEIGAAAAGADGVGAGDWAGVGTYAGDGMATGGAGGACATGAGLAAGKNGSAGGGAPGARGPP